MAEKTTAEIAAENAAKAAKTMDYILADFDRIAQRGRPLTDAQKKKIVDTLKEGVAHVENVMNGKAKAKTGFTL